MTVNRQTNRESSGKRRRRYGLLGHPLGHSLSPFIHQGIMDALGINGTYELYDIPPEELTGRMPELMALDGFNTTIPHKETIFRSLDRLSPEAKQLGAVNTVFKGVGYNTDSLGFAAVPITYADRHVLILGAGGTCRIMAHHAATQGASSITFLVRNPQRASSLAADLLNAYSKLNIRVITSGQFNTEVRKNDAPYQVILNGTPLGMWPATGELPIPERSYKTLLRSRQLEVVFDAIYNPTATRFVIIARSHRVTAYGGSGMLFAQALAAQAIWQGRPPTADIDEIARTDKEAQALRRVREALNVAITEHSPIKWVITGFMGSGKTRLAKRLGSALPLDVKVYDLDKEIVKEAGMSITDYFQEYGEEEFRIYERKLLLELLARDESMVISTGGGTIVQKGCVHDIHYANGIVISIQVSLRTALLRIGDGRNRPLAQGKDGRRNVEKLYRERFPIYRATADYIVDGNRYPQKVSYNILKAFDIPHRKKKQTEAEHSRNRNRKRYKKRPKKEGSQ